MNALAARLGVFLVSLTRDWSQGAQTRLAYALSDLVWWLARPHRRVTIINLRACFPAMPATERERIGRLSLARGVSVYSRQRNPVWDAWLLRGRRRFNDPVLIARQGIDMRSLVRTVKQGRPLYYLPDMDHGRVNSIFVPFFGVQAATIPTVSRIARMTGAKVLMAATEMTDEGYTLQFEAPWEKFPGESVEENPARMNREFERWVLRLPTRYFWAHKRFKTRPPGEPDLYWPRR